MDSTLAADASATFVGRWKHLVSSTNWEKGRIISQWRAALLAAGEPATAGSDEAWSRTVGTVTPQHVGRLRRVFERFGEVHETYPGLFWSHFQAALDWDDAEMWLEGAVHSQWSVAAMRASRWQARGKLPAEQPQPDEVVDAELDEDAEADGELAGSATVDVVRPAAGESDDDQDFHHHDDPSDEDEDAGGEEVSAGAQRSVPSRPFAELPALPADLSDAFDLFKLSILRHKQTAWRDVALDDVLATLDALKELALAPAGD